MPTTSININTAFQGSGVGAAQVALGKVGATASKAERELLAYAQAVARSQRQAGDAAGAMRTYEAALAQVDRTSKQAIATETRLAATIKQVQQESARMGQAGGLQILPRTVESFGTQAVDQFKSSILGLVGPAALVTTAISAIPKAFDLAQAGASADLVEQRFNSLAKAAGTTGNALLRALQVASGGEIDDLNLQLVANKANLLGVANSAQEFSVLMAIARDRAQSLGISTTQAFNDLVTGLGRGSALILDNLGIVVEADEVNEAYAKSIGKTATALSEAEKKQALINAVIAQGNATLAQTGGAIETNASKFAKAGASLSNLTTLVGQGFSNFLAPTLDSFNAFADASITASANAQTFLNSIRDSAAGAQAYAAALAQGKSATEAQAAADQAATASANGFADAQRNGGGGTFEFVDALKQSVLALTEEEKKKLDATIAAAGMAEKQRQLDVDSRAAASGLLGAGDQALILAKKYGIAAEQAQFLINQQQRLSNATALADQRVGERDPSNTLTAAQTAKFGKIARQGEIERQNEAKKAADKAAQDAKAAADKAAAQAARLNDVQFDNQLKKAKGNAEKIALLRKRQAATADPVERAQLEGQIIDLQSQNAKVQAQKVSGLEKEANLQERIYDSINKQRQAQLDLTKLSIDNERATAQEAKERERLQRALDSGKQSAETQDAIRLRLREIENDQAIRQFDIAEKQATAGGTIGASGNLRQSQAGGVPTPLGPQTTAGGIVPFAPGAGAAAPPFNPAVAPPPVTVNIQLSIADGKVTNAGVEGGMMNIMLNRAQAGNAGGARG